MWGTLSETITDTCNTLLHCKAWDHSEFYDILSDSIPPPSILPAEFPFKAAKPLSVHIPVNDTGKIDLYIDDNIAITVNLEDNPRRIIRAIPLAIHSIARPVDPTDDLPRVDIISLKKLKAEGKLEEVKTVLGWVINTRNLTISLPVDKHKKWTADISKIIHRKKASHTHLESLIGRLNHVAGIIPMFRHFLGRLRQALYRSAKHKWTNLKLSELSDLHISLKFLDMSVSGVSINNIVFRKPTTFYRSDTSEFGIGGYNIISGRAWRFEIPTHLRLRTSLNSLEFLACVITIWIDVLDNKILPEDCILSQTDSTSATGWLRKSNFTDAEDSSIHLVTARQLATIIIDSNACLYSQWFPGGENLIADSLSRDFHLNDDELTSFLTSRLPHQAPFGLKISPLPKEISSWLTSMLQNLHEKERWSKAPTQSSTWLGRDTRATSSQSASMGIGTWTTFQKRGNIKSSAPFATLSEKADFILEESGLVNRNQLDPPWIMYHRPLSWQTGLIPDSMEMGNLRSFYKDSFGDTEPTTLQKNVR